MTAIFYLCRHSPASTVNWHSILTSCNLTFVESRRILYILALLLSLCQAATVAKMDIRFIAHRRDIVNYPKSICLVDGKLEKKLGKIIFHITSLFFFSKKINISSIVLTFRTDFVCVASWRRLHTDDGTFNHGRRSLMRQVKINDVLLSSLPPPPPLPPPLPPPPLPETTETAGAILSSFSSWILNRHCQSLAHFRWFTSRDKISDSIFIILCAVLRILQFFRRLPCWTTHEIIIRIIYVLHVLITKDTRDKR